VNDPLAEQIKKIGDRTDEVLASAQSSARKILTRLASIVGAIAIAITVGYQVFKGFQEKTAPILEKSGVETVEQKPGSKVFRVKGR
jgi:uncharacterized membrane protein YebE (DUF533 family)